jgi:hypothetical protein
LCTGSSEILGLRRYMHRRWVGGVKLDFVHRQFRDPGPEEINALTMEGMKEAVDAQFYPENLEVNVVGDFKQQVCPRIVFYRFFFLFYLPGIGVLVFFFFF